jgi:hypothetical protein
MGRVTSVVGAAAQLVIWSSCACVLGLLSVEPAAAQSSADPVIYLNQAWSQADRETFYQIPQGSEIIDYDIFLNLEVAGSEELFRSDANIEKYGLIPQAANPRTNPDGLPVGVTKTVVAEGRFKGEAVGLTCAACHTGQLHYQGKLVRIEGGPANTFNYLDFERAFDDALQATSNDSAKFDRLAAKLGASSPDAKSILRTRFQAGADRVHHYRARSAVAVVPWGPSRIDALNLIRNRALSDLPVIPENWLTPIAPTKMPFVWNAPQGAWTQWSGVLQDPLIRNFGETVGVFLSADLTSKTREDGLFDSTGAVLNLLTIEHLLERLAPPKWPEDVFGKIDRAKAAEGKALFMSNCAMCHNAWPYTWTSATKAGKRFIDVGMVPQSRVGTDPSQFEGVRAWFLTVQLSSYLPPPYKGQLTAPLEVLSPTVQTGLLETALAKLKPTPEQLADLNGYRDFPLPKAPPNVYKAAPRDGVWATPPFLHNSSVPNLYEMLIPAQERSKKFYIGREFDPIKVGLDTSGKPGNFLFDTSLPGNSNAGHSFEKGPRGNGVIGPLLTDAQRWAILEYLKSIPDVEGRVTPFGGPPDAKTASNPWTKP